MSEGFSYIDRHLIDGAMVWNQDNADNVNSTLTDTMTEAYATAEEDSPTRYLSVLESTGEISLENLNITLANPKLEVDEPDYVTEEILQEPEENVDQVVVFNVEGSEELYGIQIVQDEEGNLQKYQFQFRKNEDGQLEAIPETITLIPMEEDAVRPEIDENLEQGYAHEHEVENPAMHIFVQEDNSGEQILPDNIEHEHIQEQEEGETAVMYENEEIEEESVDIKPGILQLQNVKQELQDSSHTDYNASDPMEEEPLSTFTEQYEQQSTIEEPSETLMEYNSDIDSNQIQSSENCISSEPDTQQNYEEQYEEVEVNPDMTIPQTDDFDNGTNDNEVANDSDENDYQIVEGLHITGDVENGDVNEEINEKISVTNTNILKHALKGNNEMQKIVKKDNRLFLYVVQHPEKENVESLSMEMSNLCRPRVNPRSILKSSHVMFPAKNEIETSVEAHDERMNKRFARCKEAMQARIFHNFINKTTIPQAPVRKNRLPRKQKIKPVERMDEEIVVQEVMVSSNGFVETVGARGVNKENFAVTEYVELTDSDEDYDPKKVSRKKKKHRRKKIEITISDESDDMSGHSVIELDESDEEVNKENPESPITTTENNYTPTKRRRGRPPKNKPGESSESPSKKSRVEPIEQSTKPEIPCPKCDKTFPSQNSLKTHLQHHNLQSSIKRALPEYKYKCEKCGTTFINNILLKKHMCSKLFNCSVCKKNFSDLAALNTHRRIHAKEQMVKCTAEIQVSPKKLRPTQQHDSFKVPKSNNLKCKKCGKLCSSLQNLNIHMKTHKEFICATCSVRFVSQLMLEKHVREKCVKSPQLRRTKSIVISEKKTPVTRSRVKSASNFPAESGLKVKCDKYDIQFASHQTLFKHKVVQHGLETPDKSLLDKGEESKSDHGGVPAASRLRNAYAGLRVQLDFNNL